MTGIYAPGVEKVGNDIMGTLAGDGTSPSLQSLTLGEVSSIGDMAFSNCPYLNYILFMAKPGCTIGYSAFNGCNVTYLAIPNGVSSIGSCAFSFCESLEAVDIPSTLTQVGYDAFYNCYSLTGVYINDLRRWCEIDFDDDSYGHGEGNPLYYAQHLFLNGEELSSLRIPEGTTKVGRHAFI